MSFCVLFSFLIHQTCSNPADETQDAAHEETQTARVRDWISSRHINSVDLSDVLSNFPDISVVRPIIFEIFTSMLIGPFLPNVLRVLVIV